jgi:uncharacterized membrane protein HdeD (DUF308 family)
MATGSSISRWSLFLGIIYIIVGVIALATPLVVAVTLFTVLFFGILLTAAGIAGLIHAFWHRGWGGFLTQLLVSVLAIAMGILLIMDNLIGAAVITLMIASYFLVGGFFRLLFAFTHANLPHKGALIFSGAIGVLLGILILVHWPSSALWVIGTFIGVDLIFYGFALLTASKKIGSVE